MSRTIAGEVPERIVAAHHEGKDMYAKLAARFKVGEASARRWLRLDHVTRSLEPKPPLGRKLKLEACGHDVLPQRVEQDNDATRPELAAPRPQALRGTPAMRG